MNSVLSIFAAPLIAIQLLMISTPSETSCKKADLIVKEITAPEYDEEIDGTTFDIIIKNKGKTSSEPTTLNAFDLDISYDEAKKNNTKKETLELIAENNDRAEYYGENKYAQVDEQKFDYDFYWEVKEKIPSLEPNEEIQITISIKNHWIYDSNCEIRVIVDPKNKVIECQEDNNQLDFFGWG